MGNGVSLRCPGGISPSRAGLLPLARGGGIGSRRSALPGGRESGTAPGTAGPQPRSRPRPVGPDTPARLEPRRPPAPGGGAPSGRPGPRPPGQSAGGGWRKTPLTWVVCAKPAARSPPRPAAPGAVRRRAPARVRPGGGGRMPPELPSAPFMYDGRRLILHHPYFKFAEPTI